MSDPPTDGAHAIPFMLYYISISFKHAYTRVSPRGLEIYNVIIILYVANGNLIFNNRINFWFIVTVGILGKRKEKTKRNHKRFVLTSSLDISNYLRTYNYNIVFLVINIYSVNRRFYVWLVKLRTI